MTTVERIKEIAKKKNLNLKSTALKAGLGENTIYKWKNQTPNSDALAKVADVLGVSVDYLLGNTDEPTPNRKPDEMTPIELDEALEQEGLVRFNGQPLSEGYKRAILSMLNTMKEEK